jgi:transcription-repair coupling factor (superfamily II helicase)
VRPVDRLIAWPASEDAEVGAEPLADEGVFASAVVRLAPNEQGPALRAAAERLEDEVRAGELVPAERVLDELNERGGVDVVLPAGSRHPAFDATEARFAVRGQAEGEAELARIARGGQRVIVAFRRRGDRDRLLARLKRIEAVPLEPSQLPAPGEIGFSVLPVERGMLSRELELAVIPEPAVFRRRRPRGARGPGVGRQVANVMDLKVGEFVVHEDHGIGRLDGFETRTVAGVTRDYLLLVFAGADRVFVPHDQLPKVSRYIGADGAEPSLSKLGGKAWDKLKARARESVREMAGELLSLYEARATTEGHAFPPEDDLTRDMERRFAHQETPDQLRAIDEVMEDMERPRPMDRLICGDVGFGKTEVAMRAAFRAAAAGKQVMVLAPTTILAQQHLATFRERFEGFPVAVDMVNRFRTQAETRQTLSGFSEGRIDVLIGTHRLLSMDVQPKDLGLVVVDEEQRFGVAQKEALRQMRLRVDVLSMSATPIPRTLQMSLSGLRDISVIETPPKGRKPIATHAGEWDDALVAEALEREASRGGQAFVLHNRVETIDDAVERVQVLAPDVRVRAAHGQMPEHELEDVMLAFIRGEADVLVATSIIEAGLDIPHANTLIVERADQLGLSQLYQIRGRVGRREETAHAYLLYPDEASLSREAAARLRAMADYTELGSGLRVAMRDLEIRGAGNLLGDEQSGHVAAVGFEMYVDMLSEAIAEGQGRAPEREVRIEIPASAFVPADYVSLEAVRIDVHRRIARAVDEDAVASLREELEDRFGPIPPAVDALLSLARSRIGLRRVGAGQATARGSRVQVAPVALTTDELKQVRERIPRAMYESRERTVTAPAGSIPSERLAALEELATALSGARERSEEPSPASSA